MILIFGGAYQGKLDYAKERFNIKDDEVLNVQELCSMAFEKNDQDLNYAVDAFMDQNSRTAKCIYRLDLYIEFLMERGLDSDAWIERLIADIKNANQSEEQVIIMNDVSQGIVPMDPEERAFREANGRAMIKLAEASDEVHRVFCGIGTRIK